MHINKIQLLLHELGVFMSHSCLQEQRHHRMEITLILCWIFSEYEEIAASPSFGPTDSG